MTASTLYRGDNLEVLRRHVEDRSVDLVYLDPPFQSGQDYGLAPTDREGEERTGSASVESAPVFADRWSWDAAAVEAYARVIEGGGGAAGAMRAFRRLLGTGDMLAYLSMMAPRLLEIHRALAPTGSLYLHCDPNASHYLKLLLDAVFGAARFQREIVWRIGWVSGYKTRARNWIRNHDVLLFYTKGERFTFNKEYLPYPEGYRRRDGKRPTGEGVPLEDTWNCQPADKLHSIQIMSFSREKRGYPTQKPEALLKRIVRASSEEGDLVLDPFCGSGTALVAAERLGRRWIGIDASEPAIALARQRLGEVRDDGEPACRVVGCRPPAESDS